MPRWLLGILLVSAVVLVLVSARWLCDPYMRKAAQQRKLLGAIREAHGSVLYDWWPGSSNPPGPPWLRRLLGDEYFQEIRGVMLDNNPFVTAQM